MIFASIYLVAKRSEIVSNLYFCVNICVICTPQHPVFCFQNIHSQLYPAWVVFSDSLIGVTSCVSWITELSGVGGWVCSCVIHLGERRLWSWLFLCLPQYMETCTHLAKLHKPCLNVHWGMQGAKAGRAHYTVLLWCLHTRIGQEKALWEQ